MSNEELGSEADQRLRAAKARLEKELTRLEELRRARDDYEILSGGTLYPTHRRVFATQSEEAITTHGRCYLLVEFLKDEIGELEPCVACGGEKIFRLPNGKVMADPCYHCGGGGLEKDHQDILAGLVSRLSAFVTNQGNDFQVTPDLKAVNSYFDRKRREVDQAIDVAKKSIEDLPTLVPVGKKKVSQTDLEHYQTSRQRMISELKIDLQSRRLLETLWAEVQVLQADAKPCGKCGGATEACSHCRGLGSSYLRFKHELGERRKELLKRDEALVSSFVGPTDESEEGLKPATVCSS